jgi:WD40 repeat protein
LRDRYLAIEPIGQGGFGRTFKAIDEDKPAKPFCVIKQFLPQMEAGTGAATKAAELFTQEASALEQLDNPSIPKLLAYFITPDRRLYLVQEFIDGQNLKGELESHGVFSQAQIRELLATLLPVLAYVHNLGFIHRDIKPENIMRRTSDGRLFLVDFGAAKMTDANRSQLQGTTIGTPEFMAPEQAWGRAFAASDLYSLGVTCIHLLIGISPFKLFDDNSGEWNWRTHLPQQIDPQLATVLDKLIQHKPGDRYATANEVIAALQGNITPPTPSVKSLDPPIATPTPTPTFTQPSPPPHVVTQTDRNWVCTHTFEWHSKPINAIAMSPDGQYLISGDDGGTVAIWNLAIPQYPIATYRANNSVWTVAASPNLSQVASGDKDRKVQLGRKESIMNSRKELHGDFSSLDSHSGFVYTVEFSPDGKILASGGADRRIRLWNTDSGKIIYTLDGHQDAVTAVKFMPNGKILISAGADRTLRFWDVESKQLLKTIEAHEQKIHAIAIGRDSKTIVSGSSDRTVQLRQLGTSNVYSLQGHQDAVLAVAISADDKTIASGSIDGTICLWDVATQQLVSSFPAHQSAVKSIVFQPSGNNFISAGWDRTIKVWQST